MTAKGKPFLGRVWWLDPTSSYNYQYQNIPEGIDRVGCFRTIGYIDITDANTCVIITDEEYDRTISKPIAVRDNVDILWGNVILIEKFKGYTNKNKEVWEEVKSSKYKK